jgi:hypothetical protein
MKLSLLTPKCQISRSGLRIEGKLSLDEWTQIIRSLRDVRHAYHCALADAICYGKENFGAENVANTLEQTEFDFQDISKATAIGTLALGFREAHDTLTSEHYFILSGVEEPERSKWAEIAQREGLKPIELKRSIEAGQILRLADIASGSGQGSGITTIQGAIFKLRQWQNTMGGPDRILELPRTQLNELLTLLTPIIELASQIEQRISSPSKPVQEDPAMLPEIELASKIIIGKSQREKKFTAIDKIGLDWGLPGLKALSAKCGEKIAPVFKHHLSNLIVDIENLEESQTSQDS